MLLGVGKRKRGYYSLQPLSQIYFTYMFCFRCGRRCRKERIRSQLIKTGSSVKCSYGEYYCAFLSLMACTNSTIFIQGRFSYFEYVHCHPSYFLKLIHLDSTTKHRLNVWFDYGPFQKHSPLHRITYCYPHQFWHVALVVLALMSGIEFCVYYALL